TMQMHGGFKALRARPMPVSRNWHLIYYLIRGLIMLIQTNLSAVKANQGTPIEVVEEWLAENGRIDSLPDSLVKGDSYFNNVNTKEIQKRQVKNKQRARDVHEAIVKEAGNLPKSKAREIDFSDEHYTNLVSQVKS